MNLCTEVANGLQCCRMHFDRREMTVEHVLNRVICCRVQFDRREMGVERVRDVDVMPINPTENLPASFIESHSHILMNGHIMVEGQAVQHHRGTLRDGPPARGPAAGRAQQEARAAAAAAQALSQESDMRTLSEVPSHTQVCNTLSVP